MIKNLPRRHLLAALLISLSASFLLCGYELIRSSSNTLYKVAYGINAFPIYLYGKILTALGPSRTRSLTTLLSGVFFLVAYFFIQRGSHLMTGVLYIFREAYVILIIEQYWSFLNSTLNNSSAKKLNGPIVGISSFGAIAGGLLLNHFAESFGTVTMLLFASVTMIPCAIFSMLAYRACGEPIPEGGLQEKHGALAIDLFRRSPLLTLLFIVMVTKVLSTVLTLRFQGMLELEIPNPDTQTAYSGGFFALLNGVATFFQFIVTPLFLRYLPLFIIHAGIPILHAIAVGVLVYNPSLFTAATALLVFKVFDYSLFRAAKELLYIPLSFDARYRTKEVIDTFGYRFSKGGTSLGLLFLGKAGFLLSTLYSWIAFGSTLLWLLLVFPLIRHYGPLKQTR